MLVLPCEQVDQLSPQLWKATEPVECSARKQLVDEECRGSAVELVLAGLHVLEAVWLVDRSVPRVPGAAVLQLYLQVDDDLA